MQNHMNQKSKVHRWTSCKQEIQTWIMDFLSIKKNEFCLHLIKDFTHFLIHPWETWKTNEHMSSNLLYVILCTNRIFMNVIITTKWRKK